MVRPLFRLRFLLTAVSALLILGFACPTHVAAKPGEFLELMDIREDISLLNLLRGLYLSRDQVQKLNALALQAQKMRDDLEGQIRKDKESITATFQGLRDSLYEAPGREKSHQEKAGQLDHRFNEARGTNGDRIWNLEQEAEALLTSAQHSIVEGFKPCLIPPKDLRNPMRVGQASGEPGILGRIADLIYATPPDIWKERGEMLLQVISTKMEQESGAMSSSMKSDLLNRLRQTAVQIRSLSDLDFHLKREGLAQEMLLIDPRKALKHGHKKNGPIANFLLSEAAVRVYPQWLKSLDKAPATAATAATAANAAIAANAANASNPATDAPLEGGAEPGDPGLTEIAAKSINGMQRSFQHRQAAQKLGPFPQFVAPVKKALDANDTEGFLQAVLVCCDRLLAIRPGPDLARGFIGLSRLTAKSKNLPLLNPQHDPYGFAAQLRSIIDNPEASDACARGRALVATLSRFKKM